MFGLGKKQKSIGSVSMSQAESILQSADTAPPISNNKYDWAAHYKGDFSGIGVKLGFVQRGATL